MIDLVKKLFAIAAGLLAAGGAWAQGLTVDVGTHVVGDGATAVVVPIAISGNLPVSDMAALVQIGAGGPSVGGAPGPKVTAISYAGSIWASAPGGFSSFYGGATPPREIVDPSVSLLLPDESVLGQGTLMELTINVAGFPPGDYPILLSGTAGGTTQFANHGQAVPVTFSNGVLRVVSGLLSWRIENFPNDYDKPERETAIWGNAANPDGDKLCNIFEFLHGLNPNVSNTAPVSASAPGLPVFGVEMQSGQRYFVLRYSLRAQAPGWTLRVDVSQDLITWDTSEGSIQAVGSPTPIGDGTTVYVVKRYATPLGSNPTGKAFFRLAAVPPP